MKIVLTGSLGNISKPLAQKLLAAGHQVSIISSSADKKESIEKLGAKALIGSVEDQEFLNHSFSEADAVYLIIPPKWNFPGSWIEYQAAVSNNFVKAIQENGIKYVVALSSVGAHMKKGAGPVDGLAYLEDRLAEVEGLNVKVLRPSYFFNNLFSMVGMVKNMGILGSTQPSSHSLVLTATEDIADVAFEELNNLNFKGFTIRYIASDERTWTEIAAAIGKEIGKPELPFIEFSDDQSAQGMAQMGLPPTIVQGYLDMGQALRSGEMEADYKANRPEKLGKTKLEDFAKKFASVYQAS
jgi:uncharacterized protein YbjT (DUF2867 family)